MVDRVDINSVLMQMRQVKTQLRSQHEQSTAAVTPQSLADQVRRLQADEQVQAIQGDNTVPDFQSMFKSAIDTVNANQKASAELATRFEQGDPSIDLPEVMIALQKSSVSFQAMTQVRNKLVEAYKDVMNMPV
ncbi:flagellar hook-basal body complex protein FliE [Thalassolituus marinus]|uniref:Flagellar hook-basal body complex protein FliE n=1 Tax=Thalassolituus marinus TaxID=671053 RepID=A0ABS7ZQH3_9GAMM|nr:flagellar hook-basal body complex protein FliE [Thalassolituus marinus]MCA6062835.1 flagellar hook-basal body complex protein FliE [Thalassolituus marinus]